MTISLDSLKRDIFKRMTGVDVLDKVLAGIAAAKAAGLERVGVGSVELIPVAAPDHPLARARRNAPGAGREVWHFVADTVNDFAWATARAPFTSLMQRSTSASPMPAFWSRPRCSALLRWS